MEGTEMQRMKWTKYGVLLGVFAAATCVLATSAMARPFAVPTVTGFAPTHGPIGEKVTIYGHNLTGAQVSFAGVMVLVKDVTVDPSGTHVTALVPQDAQLGAGAISLTTLGGTVSSATKFTVNAAKPVSSSPRISSFAPMRGKVGSKVTIKGANLGGTMWVRIGGVKALFTVPSVDRIVVTVPKKVHSGKITLQTSNGGATNQLRFTLIPAA
jgi:hypothetical protein